MKVVVMARRLVASKVDPSVDKMAVSRAALMAVMMEAWWAAVLVRMMVAKSAVEWTDWMAVLLVVS